MQQQLLTKSLFDRLGGKPAVDAAVERFYDRLLKDERVKHFFNGVDIAAQRRKQKAFMSYAFGGLPNYPGKSIRQAHATLVKEKGLNDSHFDAVAENLKGTLEDLGVPANLIGEVLGIVGGTRNDVLNR